MIGALLWPSAGWAQHRIELPIEVALETQRLELDLTDARVVITIDSSRPARFSAHAADPGIGGDVSLEGAISPQAATQIWRRGTGGDLPTIVVDINVVPDQVLVINGKHLDLGITFSDSTIEPNPAAEPDTPSKEATVKAPESADHGTPGDTGPGISVRLEDSAFRATRLQGLNLAATRSIIDLDITSGPLEIELVESEVHVRGLTGSSTLHAIASDVAIEDAKAGISVDLEEGSLTATRSDLKLNGTVSNTELALTTLFGSAQLDGSNTRIWITDGRNLPVHLKGTDLDIVLDDVGGPIRAELIGGQIQADTIGGRFDLKLEEGAEADLRDLENDLAIALYAGSTAGVSHVAGHTRISLNDSELEVSDLKSLELHAQVGRVTGTDIRNLTHIEMTDTDLDISLPGIQGKHDILLRGSTNAVVRLPTPCRVVAKMPDTTDGDRLRVSGCLLDFDGSAKRGMQRGIDGQPPIRLNATLDDSATLDVQGLP